MGLEEEDDDDPDTVNDPINQVDLQVKIILNVDLYVSIWLFYVLTGCKDNPWQGFAHGRCFMSFVHAWINCSVKFIFTLILHSDGETEKRESENDGETKGQKHKIQDL